MAEITSLGLTYRLAHAVHVVRCGAGDRAAHELRSADDVDQPLPLPAGVSDLAVGVTNGPEPEIVWVCAIAVALARCV